jgi:hypothetical protein
MAYERIRNEINERAAIRIGSPKGEIQELLTIYYEEPAGWRNAIINWAKTLIPIPLKHQIDNRYLSQEPALETQ